MRTAVFISIVVAIGAAGITALFVLDDWPRIAVMFFAVAAINVMPVIFGEVWPKPNATA